MWTFASFSKLNWFVYLDKNKPFKAQVILGSKIVKDVSHHFLARLQISNTTQ